MKAIYFVLAGINSFSTAFYVYYLFFFLQEHFGFDRKLNLTFAAVSGAVYTVAAFYGGKFGQKHGCVPALTVGYAIMTLAAAGGGLIDSLSGHVVVLIAWTIGMCFTWPPLEALVTEGEPAANLPRMVGIYNLVWAGTNGLAYFIGGALIETFGKRFSFYLPCVLSALQFATVAVLARTHTHREKAPSIPEGSTAGTPDPQVRTFLRLAWLANPCAYVAINTVIPVIPQLAARLGLSPMYAGFYCSIWFLTRWIAFAVLWRWPGWHFRFSWLVGAYLALIVCFVLMMSARNLATLVGVQVLFGLALGLIYYSSLYYSMEGNDSKSEHGGIHEAAIGFGNCLGPALSAGALHYFGTYPHSGTLAVATVLIGGLAGLFSIWLFSDNTPKRT